MVAGAVPSREGEARVRTSAATGRTGFGWPSAATLWSNGAGCGGISGNLDEPDNSGHDVFLSARRTKPHVRDAPQPGRTWISARHSGKRRGSSRIVRRAADAAGPRTRAAPGMASTGLDRGRANLSNSAEYMAGTSVTAARQPHSLFLRAPRNLSRRPLRRRSLLSRRSSSETLRRVLLRCTIRLERSMMTRGSALSGRRRSFVSAIWTEKIMRQFP